MKTTCKIICWILGIFMGFILVNLIVGTIKYGGTGAYSKILNQKDRQQSLSEISLLKPKTRVAIFYENSQEDTEKKVEENLLNELDTEASAEVDDIISELLSGDAEVTEEENINHNPYDPDYEDEFNSFFGVTSEETGEIIPVQKIENLETAGFIVDENSKD